MTEYWMIDVLADLRKFAENNSMAKLVEQLDDTIHIATTEMANIKYCTDKKTTLKPSAFVV